MLTDDAGTRKKYRVHRLILEAFVGRNDGAEGLHFPDPDKRNCRIANLRWGSREENINDNRSLGRWASKLTPEKVEEIRQALGSGAKSAEIARREGVHRDTIGRIKRGKSWRQPDVDAVP